MKTCIDCGEPTQSNKSDRCPECRKEHRKRAWRERAKRERIAKANGTYQPVIGELMECKQCGRSVTRTGARMEYCTTCRKIRAKEHTNKYMRGKGVQPRGKAEADIPDELWHHIRFRGFFDLLNRGGNRPKASRCLKCGQTHVMRGRICSTCQNENARRGALACV